MLVTKLFQFPIYFHVMKKNEMEVNGNQNYWAPNILQNIFLVSRKKCI